MGIIVQKYGGSSVKDTEHIMAVAKQVVATRDRGWQVVVVLSAMGDSTDALIAKARAITCRPARREIDMLLSTGEQVSISLLAMAIDSLGYPVVSLTGAQAGIHTDSVHTKAHIHDVSTDRLQKELAEGRIVIVAGFQGINAENDITTLGRGGSDTTAVALAAALGADMCEIYTDVDGVYTADPRLVKQARKLSDISYGEMLEMASLGALVLQPRAVEYAAMHQVVIHVRNSGNGNKGTYVQGERKMEKDMLVIGVAHDTNVAKVAIIGVPDRPGVSYRIFSRMAAEGINVDMIVQTTKKDGTADLIFSISRDDAERVQAMAQQLQESLNADEIHIDLGVAKISIVGAGMMTNPGVAARMFEALAEQNINIQIISTSEIKVSCLIAEERIADAARAVHAAFGLAK